ncbi:MAG TPA: DUF58 domain-containing protein [Chloroflexota bacterium]
MILNRWWLIVLAAGAGLGVRLGQPLLTLAGLFGLLLAGAGWLWQRHCLTGVEYARSLSASHALWGEEVVLSLRIANRKLLPLTWLEAEERVPVSLPIPRARVVEAPNATGAYLRNLLPMLPYEQVIRRYVIPCRRRGLFEFGPAALRSGDLLGFTSRTAAVPAVDRLIVYPKLFELDAPAPASRRIVGARRAPRVILTDPSRTIGVRSYQAGDTLRHVEWRASARSPELLVRVFEPTTDLALAIFLNFRFPTFSWSSEDAPELEFAISLAASLARWGLERKYPVGVFGNAATGRSGGLRVPVSGDPGQLPRVLEALALAAPHHESGPGEVLLRESASLPYEASVVLISGAFDHWLMAAMEEVRRRRALTVWQVETILRRPAPRLPGVPVVHVPFDEDWQQRDHVQLAA